MSKAAIFYFISKYFISGNVSLGDLLTGIVLVALFCGFAAIGGGALGFVVAKISDEDVDDYVTGGAIIGAIAMLILIFVV